MPDESGFKIATAFISVEAGVNQASVTKARADLTGATRPAPAGRGPTGTPAPGPAGPVSPLGQQLAASRTALSRTGTEAADALERGFKSGLSSLSNMAVQQLRSLSTEARQTPPRQVQTNVGIQGQGLPGPRPPAAGPAGAPIQVPSPAAIQAIAAQQRAAAQQAQRSQQAATQASAQQRPAPTQGRPTTVVNNYN